MKRILVVLMFVVAFGIVMSSVAGADMLEHDFDGKCKVQIPDEGKWMGDQVPFGEGIHGGGISIHYFTNDDLNGESIDDLIDTENCDDVQTDGNLTIYKMGKKYAVLINTSNEYLIVQDKNLEEAKAIASSADFGDKSTDEPAEPSTPVNATVELESHDFDDFKMDVPKDSSFKEITDNDAEFNGAKTYFDSVNDVNITFAENEEVNDQLINDMVSSFEEHGVEVKTNGNLNIVSMDPYNEVIFNDGNKIIMIVTTKLDPDTITAMAQSAEFTE